MKNNRVIFLIIGFIMLINAFLINGAYIFSGKFPEGLMIVALTIMAFCSFKTKNYEKDEIN